MIIAGHFRQPKATPRSKNCSLKVLKSNVWPAQVHQELGSVTKKLQHSKS